MRFWEFRFADVLLCSPSRDFSARLVEIRWRNTQPSACCVLVVVEERTDCVCVFGRVLDDEPRNVLLAVISQLRIGMDLSRVVLPVFILEPRSMLERVTDFLSHPDLIFGYAVVHALLRRESSLIGGRRSAGAIESPQERFIQVVRYYLAGWHIKPRGVKKPFVHRIVHVHTR